MILAGFWEEDFSSQEQALMQMMF